MNNNDRMTSNENEPEKVQVCVTLPAAELEDMRGITRLDTSAPAVLSLARRGLEAMKAQEAK